MDIETALPIAAVVVIAAYLLHIKRKKKNGPKNPRPTDNTSGVQATKTLVRKMKSPNTRFMWVDENGWTGTYNRDTAPVVTTSNGDRSIKEFGESAYDCYYDKQTDRHYLCGEESGGKVISAETGKVIFTGGAHSTIMVRRVLGKLVTISANWNASKNDCRVQINGGKAIALNHNGHKFFVRSVIEYNNKALIWAHDKTANIGGFFRSSDLKNWRWYGFMPNTRPMRCCLYDGGVAVTVSPYIGGKRVHPGGVGLWKDGKFTILHSTNDGRIGMPVVANGKALYYAVMDNWKGGGKSYVYTNQDGTWKRLAEFDEAEAWGLAFHKGTKNKLYVATGQEGSSAALYRLGDKNGTDYSGEDNEPDVVPTNDDPEIQNLKEDGVFIWKPESDVKAYGYKACIVLPAGWSAKHAYLRFFDDGVWKTDVMYTGGPPHLNGHSKELGGRQVWRAHKQGHEYPAYTQIILDHNVKREVPNPALRYGKRA